MPRHPSAQPGDRLGRREEARQRGPGDADGPVDHLSGRADLGAGLHGRAVARPVPPQAGGERPRGGGDHPSAQPPHLRQLREADAAVAGPPDVLRQGQLRRGVVRGAGVRLPLRHERRRVHHRRRRLHQAGDDPAMLSILPFAVLLHLSGSFVAAACII
eukprot:scaffold368464_cov34-Prasinocladus_malaysianus.AAC.1